MKDEKQILEIAKTLCNNNFCRRSEFVDCQYTQGTYCPRCMRAATALYDADYRKRGEVVDDFSNKLKEYLDDFYTTDEDALLDTCDAIDGIATEIKEEKP